MEASEKQQNGLDLGAIFNRVGKAVRRLWILILLLMVLGGAVDLYRGWKSYVPMYQSKAIISVTSGYNTGDIFSAVSYYDSAAAQQMARTFPYLISADMTRDLIVQKIGNTYYNGYLSYETLAETNLLQLTVTSPDPHDACDILNAVIECYPQVAVYMVDNPQLNIRQAPEVPAEPFTSFDGTRAFLKGMLKGLMISAVLVAVQALLIQPVSSARELKRIINLPLLAAVPRVRLKKDGKPANGMFITAADDIGLAESLRGLRTRVMKQLDAKNGKIVLMTSTIPGEGKSTVSTNLALSMASAGKKVALVDADLRNQTIYRMFGDREDRLGLMDCLNDGELDVVDCMQRAGDSRMFYLSGSSTRKRHYSIDARSLRRILEQLSRDFDYIVVDTPPCTVVSDTAMLSRFADAVIYVVRQDCANQHQILDGVTALYERGVSLTGCVLNDVKRGFSTGRGYGYGYGYGAKSDQKSRYRHSSHRE